MSVPPYLALPAGAVRRWVPTSQGPLAAIEVAPAGTADGTAVLVPGFTGSKEDFVAVLGPLAGCGWRVVALDLRGQLDSAGPPRVDAYLLEPLASDVADAVRTLAEESGQAVHLVGHSLGGLVARAAVHRAGTAVSTLTLLSSGPAAIPPPRLGPVPALAAALPHTPLHDLWVAKEALDRAQGWDPPPPQVQEFLRRRFLAANPWALRGMAEVLMTATDDVDELALSGLPVLVAHGEGDDVWPLDLQDAMARRLGAPPVSIAGCAHSPAAEAPAATAALLDGFWRTGSPATGLRTGGGGDPVGSAGVRGDGSGYPADMHLDQRLDSTAAAAGQARRIIADTLPGWGATDRVDDAGLVASELIGNAIRHGQPPLRLTLSRTATTLRVAVGDGSPTRLPLPVESGPEQTGGRGLLVIAALTRQWGWNRDGSGKTVWADLSVI